MHWTDKVGKNNETLPNKIKAILEKKQIILLLLLYCWREG